jgi:translation elongation factor EF-4
MLFVVLQAPTTTISVSGTVVQVANFYLAFEQELAIVPLLNKIDMDAAEPDRVAKQLHEAFDIDPQECLRVSAKTGLGLHDVLNAVVERVPAPRGDPNAPPRLLLFDAYHDEYRQVNQR